MIQFLPLCVLGLVVGMVGPAAAEKVNLSTNCHEQFPCSKESQAIKAGAEIQQFRGRGGIKKTFNKAAGVPKKPNFQKPANGQKSPASIKKPFNKAAGVPKKPNFQKPANGQKSPASIKKPFNKAASN